MHISSAVAATWPGVGVRPRDSARCGIVLPQTCTWWRGCTHPFSSAAIQYPRYRPVARASFTQSTRTCTATVVHSLWTPHKRLSHCYHTHQIHNEHQLIHSPAFEALATPCRVYPTHRLLVRPSLTNSLTPLHSIDDLLARYTYIVLVVFSCPVSCPLCYGSRWMFGMIVRTAY